VTSLPDFEADARTALTARAAVEAQELMENFVELVHARLDSYAQANGYDIQSTKESVSSVTTDVQPGRVTARVEWQNPQIGRYEFGVEPHEIRAKNAEVLSFVWKSPPEWVKDEFDQARASGGQFESGWRVFFESVEWGSDTGGIPASRAIRNSLNGLRALL